MDSEFEDYWNGWLQKELSNYKLITDKKTGVQLKKYLKKNYTHFDNKFWLPDRKDELKKILQNNLKIYNSKLKRTEWWAFSPFLKMLIKTPRYKYSQDEGAYDLETKIRPICFAAHVDSLIFSFYAYMLTRKYESFILKEGFSDCVIAYRSDLGGKCNIQFCKEVFDEVKSRGACSAVALDIKGYFDHIDHIILKDKWGKIVGGLPDDQFKLFNALTTYSYVNKNNILKKYNVILKRLAKLPNTLLDLVPGKKDYEKYKRLRDDKLIVVNNTVNKKTKRPIGIPQGSGMSALLSNIYLIDFDKDLQEKAIREGFLYRRYCDDILVVCDSSEAQRLQKFIIDKIGLEYHQEIQSKKVELTEFRLNSAGKIRAFNKKKQIEKGVLATDALTEKYYYKSLQYLGFEFDGHNIFIRSASLSRYFRKMKSRIVKTIAMAYSGKSTSNKVWKEQLLHRYTHLGKRNFTTYAYNASKATYKNVNGDMKDGLDAPSIKRQLARHVDILMNSLQAKNAQRYRWKASKDKSVIEKKI